MITYCCLNCMLWPVNTGLKNAELCRDEMKMNLLQSDGMSKMGRKIGSAYDPKLTTPSVKHTGARMYGCQWNWLTCHL